MGLDTGNQSLSVDTNTGEGIGYIGIHLCASWGVGELGNLLSG